MGEFIDFYELMQINPNAELQTIQRVYRMLAARYHPDNPESGDTDKFVLLRKAYDVLSDPEKREAYDKECSDERSQPMEIFESRDFIVGIDVEINRRLGVLCLLYNQRREAFDHPGMSLLEMEVKMQLPREHLEFTIWYLRERGLVRRDDTSSEILITAEGADFVETNISSNRIVHKLLKSGEREEEKA